MTTERKSVSMLPSHYAHYRGNGSNNISSSAITPRSSSSGKDTPQRLLHNPATVYTYRLTSLLMLR
jgi:hypothetical protein